jgi:hypothetical protein
VTHLSEPVRKKHEILLQERRLERETEDRKLMKLKVRLQAKILQQQQPPLLALAG